MESFARTLHGVLQGIENAATLSGRPGAVKLLAVSKTRPAEAVRALAAAGQRAFGENYVQEGVGKRQALADLDLEWHLIGHRSRTNAARPPLTSTGCIRWTGPNSWMRWTASARPTCRR
jgi:uncharacterized pyridoxal phosphate-containing UPF0001 family protein